MSVLLMLQQRGFEGSRCAIHHCTWEKDSA
jgi:hypothetical protein